MTKNIFCIVICIKLINVYLIIAVDMEEGETQDRDRADPEFVRILEIQTSQLERRVRACQARIMIVTCFDAGV